MDYEIDLRKYLVAVARRWYLILALGIVAALIAFAISYTTPRSYTATSTVLLFIRQTGSQLGTNEPLLSIETIDVGSRRQGLVSLASSSTIEARLPSDVVQQVVSGTYKPGMLVDKEAIEVTPSGDLLEIEATAATAQQAKLLADTWARTYVDQVRQLYTDEHSSAELAGEAVLPVSPNPSNVVRNTVVGGILGALLAVACIIVATVLQPIRTPRVTSQDRVVGNPSPTR